MSLQKTPIRTPLRLPESETLARTCHPSMDNDLPYHATALRKFDVYIRLRIEPGEDGRSYNS